jgi:Domain of unknown function (DUF3597)
MPQTEIFIRGRAAANLRQQMRHTAVIVVLFLTGPIFISEAYGGHIVSEGQTCAGLSGDRCEEQKLNYDKSIVDLLKLLDLDSSLTARQELANELGYSGDTKGSSKMNVWLHKEVMRQLAANGGKVPKTWMA